MTERDINQPLDHLPPQKDREEDIETPDHPGTPDPSSGYEVSPETAAEPDEAARHGVHKLPPHGR